MASIGSIDAQHELPGHLLFTSIRSTRSNNDMGSSTCKSFSGVESNSTVASGDDGNLAGLVRNIIAAHNAKDACHFLVNICPE